MSDIFVTGKPGEWKVTIGTGINTTSYIDKTPGRGKMKAEERAQAVADRAKSSGGSAYTSNVFLFGAQGMARARAFQVGGLFGEDIAAAERALVEADHDG